MWKIEREREIKIERIIEYFLFVHTIQLKNTLTTISKPVEHTIMYGRRRNSEFSVQTNFLHRI